MKQLRGNLLIAVWLVTGVFTVITGVSTASAKPSTGLCDTTIMIIRHAEKPETGFELSPDGEKRAAAYVNYFENLTIDSNKLTPDFLVATADSKGSHRPRLTLEPLSKAVSLKIDDRFKNKDAEKLAEDLKATPHGKHILIAWHHGEIPKLVESLGADPATVIPGSKWPAEVFGWVIILRYDHEGQLIEARHIDEHLMPDDTIK